MEESTVFFKEQLNVGAMRIPGAVTTPEGTVLAFCEARDGGDRTPTDMVLRRSFDSGMTWEPVQLCVKAKGCDAMMNPCPVVDVRNERILLLFNLVPHGSFDYHAQPGVVRTMVCISEDEGASWTAPTDITEDVLDTNTEFGKCTGPGRGIQTDDGTLMVPLGLGPEDEAKGTVIYSEDSGSTWQSTSRVTVTGSEIQLVELADGSLRLDMRNQRPEEEPYHCRYYAISADRGASWSGPFRDDGLVDTACQGTILRYALSDQKTAQGNTLVFANPASSYRNRVNMTVRLSEDGGNTWQAKRTVHPGPCAYSCLTVLGDGKIGLLYERGEEDKYATISFARFPLDWVKK